MKLRSAPLDDLYNEVDFVLRADGGFVARRTLRVARAAYGLTRGLMLVALRRRWRDRAATVSAAFPPIGEEPFNISPAEMKENW